MKLFWIWIVLGLVLLFGSGLGLYEYYNRPVYSRYQPIIDALMKHQIAGDDGGRVDLSHNFPNVTAENKAFVTWRDDGSIAAFFPTSFGEGQQAVGLLYTSRPLVDSDFHFRTSATRFANRAIAVGSYSSLLVDKKLNESWYMVSYHLK